MVGTAVVLLLVAAFFIFFPGVWRAWFFQTATKYCVAKSERFDIALAEAGEEIEEPKDEAAARNPEGEDEAAAPRDAAAANGEEAHPSSSMFTKLKIVIACYQIVYGMLLLFPTIRWPLSYVAARTYGRDAATSRRPRGCYMETGRRRGYRVDIPWNATILRRPQVRNGRPDFRLRVVGPIGPHEELLRVPVGRLHLATRGRDRLAAGRLGADGGRLSRRQASLA